MPSTVISRFYTPEDNAGNRDILHPETEIEAVVDPVNGKHLSERLSDIESCLVEATDTHNGFLTATSKVAYDSLLQNKIIVAAKKPDLKPGCVWMNVIATEH